MAHTTGLPWERSEDQTVDTTSLSWDTDDIQIPNSWDKGEKTTEDTNHQTTEEASTEESQTEETESEDSLPELVSDEADTSRDSGYAFLNTPPSTEEQDAEAEERDREEEKQKMYKEIDKIDEEARMQESTIDLILNMENTDYKEPEPCTGLTCPLTEEQYYVD